jgi:hypothetical protein
MRVPPERRKRPAEFCDRMSEERRGEGNPMWGRKLTEEHVQKLKQSRSKPQPEWRKKQISESMKRYHAEHPRSEKTRKKLSDAGKKSRRPYNVLRILDISMIRSPDPISKRVSELFKGKPLKREHREKISRATKGRVFTEEHKEKLSNKKIGVYVGDRSPHWKGGISFEPYCPKFNNAFKERVRDFFGRVCVECGAPENGKRLSVHHVNFNKMTCCDGTKPLFVPLCPSCHAKTQKDREYWEDHFTDLINTQYNGKCY